MKIHIYIYIYLEEENNIENSRVKYEDNYHMDIDIFRLITEINDISILQNNNVSLFYSKHKVSKTDLSPYLSGSCSGTRICSVNLFLLRRYRVKTETGSSILRKVSVAQNILIERTNKLRRP
jgi:hypothetical protein